MKENSMQQVLFQSIWSMGSIKAFSYKILPAVCEEKKNIIFVVCEMF